MAKIFNIVLAYYWVLLSTIGYLGTSSAIVHQMCRNPLEPYMKTCTAQRKTDDMPAFYCELEAAGFIGPDGHIVEAKYRETYLRYVMPGKEYLIGDVLKAVKDCLNKAGPIMSTADAENALTEDLDTLLPLFMALRDALCKNP